MEECLHTKVSSEVKVDHVRASAATPPFHHAEVVIRCDGCGTRFSFAGLPRGWSPDVPTTDETGTTARLPITAHAIRQ